MKVQLFASFYSLKSRMPGRHAARIRWRHSSIIQQCKKLCKYETPRLQKQSHAEGATEKHFHVVLWTYRVTRFLDMLVCMSQVRSEWCVVNHRDMFSFSHAAISELALDHRPLGWDCTCDCHDGYGYNFTCGRQTASRSENSCLMFFHHATH